VSRASTAALLLLATLAAGVLYRFDPLRVSFYPRCPLYLLTGLYCPGCGALRAGHALLHGRLEQALGYNLLAVAAAPGLAYSGLARASAPWLRRRLPSPFIPAPLIWSGLAVLLAFTVLRNLPYPPFSLLAP
jgi:hypothetical protein